MTVNEAWFLHDYLVLGGSGQVCIRIEPRSANLWHNSPPHIQVPIRWVLLPQNANPPDFASDVPKVKAIDALRTHIYGKE
ncbi:MAG: hypothetical protein KTR25_19270, partial [Myxococcales bacterium]|nr:hypothetical protein [Myxococcales bacterium]